MDAKALLRMIRPGRPQDPTVLEIDLAKGVVNAQPSSPVEAIRTRHATAMRDLRDGLRAGAEDPSIAGLAVHIGTCPLTPDQCDEVGQLIAEFDKVKPAIAWTESFGELSNATLAYRLASFAREIWVQPSGAVGLHGIHVDIVLLRGLLEKLGMEPQFAQRKEYKSAAEQYAGREVSEANREMMQRIADSILEDTVAGVAERRHLDPEAVRHAVDNSPLTAVAAREAGLIDRLGYRDEVYADLRARFGRPEGEDKALGLRYAQRYARSIAPAGPFDVLVNRAKPAIGVVQISGPIVTGPSQPGPGGSTAGSDTITANLREAARDDTVKAVIVRVDSPGGSYIASDAIRREILQLRQTGKPVVAAMGSYAASGGYFVSMGCDTVIANPTTLTGSIGVLAGKFVTEDLFGKLGLVREPINAGEQAGTLSGAQPFTDEQWQHLNAWLDEVYADFTAKAAQDRGMDLAELEPLARGRVWTGSDAHRRKLVDRLGGIATAIDHIAGELGVRPESLPLRPVPALPWLDQVKPPESSESSGVGVGLGGLTGSPEDRLRAAARMLGVEIPGGVLALPWQIRIR